MNNTWILKYLCRRIQNHERINLGKIDVNKYQSLLGLLIYISVKSRPDIAYAVNQASRHNENPTLVSYKALLMI